MHLPPPRIAERAFEPAASSVSAARRFVTDCLEQWDLGSSVWSVQLALSELATNAVLHAGGSGFTAGVEVLTGGVVRLTITDQSPRPPRLRDYGTSATTGRGVALVDELSREWGVEPREGGKAVWCEIWPEPGRLRLVEDEDDEDVAAPDLDSFLGPEDEDTPTSGGRADVRADLRSAA